MVIDELATRAHPALRDTWSPLRLVHLERKLWVDIMLAQRKLGLDIPSKAISASITRMHPGPGVLDRIQQRELLTRHDLKARLEIFCEDAGHEHHHLGMTSADVVENVYQIRVRDSLIKLYRWWGIPFDPNSYPLRGIRGPMGTQQDQIDLLGSVETADELDRIIARANGFPRLAGSVPQVMYRSLDLQVVSALNRWAIDHTDSHGRPLCGLLSGFQTMVAAIVGETWNEGDVSASVVRRVALPGAIFAFDVAMRGWDTGAVHGYDV
jgi:adenylosuccinate lyase